jgi:16S rRNA C967 or C1407 C5-methylase (RsmB/RsmF family)/NOL1/NOP2/fmu family ribosome biogenesis protein
MELPQDFLKRMEKRLDREFPAFIAALESQAVVSIRLNPFKPSPVPKGSSGVPWHPMGYYLPERPSFVADPHFHAGAYYVQEAASMILYQLVDFSKDMRILDLSAAPGGKSTLMAGEMSPGSLLVANEVIRSRAGILAENLTRWGNPNCMVTQNDPKDFKRLPDFFDLILVDAPCSGEGMFRKEPAAIAEWSPDQVEVCAARQKRILSDILPALKAGGILIYSTCTFSQEENEANMEWLLKEAGGELEPYPFRLSADWGFQYVGVGGEPGAAAYCFPHRAAGEGLFFCRLRKKGHTEERPGRKNPSKKERSRKKQDTSFLKDWIESPEFFLVQEENDFVRLFPEALAIQSEEVGRALRVIQSGILAGKRFRNGFNPSHALALSTAARRDLPEAAFSGPEALDYLLKKDVALPPGSPTGWVLVSYESSRLGWVKSLADGKVKNYFPTNWRIRKEPVD